MRRWLGLLLAGAWMAGCTGRTAPLPVRGQRSAGADAGARQDAGAPVDAGAGVCAFVGDVAIDGYLEGAPGAALLEASGTLFSVSPVVVAVEGEGLLVLEVLSVPSVRALEEGRRVFVRFASSGLEDGAWLAVISELSPDGGEGTPRLAAWSLNPDSSLLEIAGVQVKLQDDACDAADLFQCGLAVTASLQVSGEGLEVSVPARQWMDTGSVVVANGASHSYVDGLTCPDAQRRRSEGYVELYGR